MCGRTTITVTKEELENYYRASFAGDFQPTYNAAPSQLLPIVRNISPGKIELAKWGFLPKWLKEKRRQGFINSKAETIFEKPMFKNAVLNKRCLVPADGFFEWQDQTRVPYYIKVRNSKIFSFAGIWEDFKDEEYNDVLTYSILTTSSRLDMQSIHGRMPVILERDKERLWLEARGIEEIKDALKKPVDDFEMYAISKRINSPRNNYPALLNRAAETRKQKIA